MTTLAEAVRRFALRYRLAPREQEIALAFASGETRAWMVDRFDITETTLKTHVRRICQATSSQNLTEMLQLLIADELVAKPTVTTTPSVLPVGLAARAALQRAVDALDSMPADLALTMARRLHEAAARRAGHRVCGYRECRRDFFIDGGDRDATRYCDAVCAAAERDAAAAERRRERTGRAA
jgi:DNA-binding CsgD family transcriptional regulator